MLDFDSGRERLEEEDEVGEEEEREKSEEEEEKEGDGDTALRNRPYIAYTEVICPSSFYSHSHFSSTPTDLEQDIPCRGDVAVAVHAGRVATNMHVCSLNIVIGSATVTTCLGGAEFVTQI